MPTEPLSPKQRHAIRECTSRINIWEGAVRSGKTYSSILAFLRFCRYGPPGAGMIVGVSRGALQRNVFPELCDIIGIPLPTPKADTINIFNRTVHIVGAADERAQSKIQGATLATAYCDELTNLPEGFFRMLLSRLSVSGARLFGTTNPDSPFHWLKTGFLDRDDLDMSVFKFKVEDNPSLDPDYVSALKREYQGLWHQRYIDGLWVLAEGTVYSFFDEMDHTIVAPPSGADRYVVGVDYGTTNPTAFVLLGISHRTWPNYWVEDEYYWDSRERGRQKTDAEYALDLQNFIGQRPVKAIYIDPSAASFKTELQRQGFSGIVDANNDVLDGIRYVSTLMSTGALKICGQCNNLIKEMQTYRWCERAARRGEDKPIKENDHGCDALRYAVYTQLGQRIGNGVSKEQLDQVWSKVSGVDQSLPAFFR